MTAGMTTTAVVTPAPSTSPYADFYDRVMLTRAVANFVHQKWAQVRDIPANAGQTIKFRKYTNLTAATTALTEGTTPAGSVLAVTDIVATPLQYGDFVTMSDKVKFTTLDPLLTETAELLGDQAGDTLDQLTRDVIAAGTTIQYASSAGSEGAITASMIMNASEVREAVRTLQTNNAKPVMRMVDSSNAYGSKTIMPAYIGIIHPKTLFDLKADSAWVKTSDYANKSDVMENEVGSIDEVRFVMSTNSKYAGTVGSSAAPVYKTVIFGRDFYGITRISGESLKNIVKPLGSGGTTDPLDQRATSGWKATFVAKILNQDFGVVIEHGVTA